MAEKKMSVRRRGSKGARPKPGGRRGDEAALQKREWARSRAAVVRQLRILLEGDAAPAKNRAS